MADTDKVFKYGLSLTSAGQMMMGTIPNSPIIHEAANALISAGSIISDGGLTKPMKSYELSDRLLQASIAIREHAAFEEEWALKKSMSR